MAYHQNFQLQLSFSLTLRIHLMDNVGEGLYVRKTRNAERRLAPLTAA